MFRLELGGDQRARFGGCGVGGVDGKIKALPSLVVFVRSINGLWRSRWKDLLALFGSSPMISMPFVPSSIAFGRLAIGQSWTAREKLGCPGRVYDWDN
jgi:hypothetical protein